LNGEYVDAPLSQTDCNGSTDVLVGVEPNSHRRLLRAARRSASGDVPASA
jgi:hypothetical protein